MKRSWQPEELIEHWTLIPTELDLLTKKTASNRLGIALLLKYFQYEGRFPTSKADIPRDVVCYVAQVLKVPPDKFDSYDWQGRTIKAHRAIVREFLGITEATVKDALDLTAWLESQVLAYDLKPESLEIAARERLRHLKIEPPTSERLERIVRSAIRRFEENCDFRHNFAKFSSINLPHNNAKLSFQRLRSVTNCVINLPRVPIF